MWRGEEMSLSDSVKIVVVLDHITEVFLFLYWEAAAVSKIDDMMVLNSSVAKKLEQTSLESVYSHSILQESVRNHNEVEMGQFWIVLVINHERVCCSLWVVPVKPLRCILENKRVVLGKITDYYHFSRLKRLFFVLQKWLLFPKRNKQIRSNLGLKAISNTAF